MWVKWTAPEGACVLVQDYHLALVGTRLAQQRKDLRAVHFTHIPFCEPGAMRMLPRDVAEELLVGMSSHASCGFHARRWADAFSACCSDVLGLSPATFVSPIAPDADDLAKAAASEESAREAEWVDQAVGSRRLILRVDRLELSKNVLRGFWAYDELLATHPELRGQVVFMALVYASREALPEYLAYRQEVESLVRLLNDRWSTPGWTPILLDSSDNYYRSVAALARYDLLLVNPIRDGMNLVAKEGPLLNRTDGVLALSREAGAWEELREVALEVNPFDVSGTAQALLAGLTMGPGDRAAHAAGLRDAITARIPRDWLRDQLAAAAG
jgi:trehalose 6-phosphate synthase